MENSQELKIYEIDHALSNGHYVFMLSQGLMVRKIHFFKSTLLF